MTVLNPLCFMFNTLAIGDVIAAVPVIKWALDNLYTDPKDYIVVSKGMFRPFFHFVPDSNWRDFDKKDNSWDVPATFAMTTLNQKKEQLARNTPKHMHLAQFASIKMLDRILNVDQLNYLPIQDAPIDHLNLPKKYVVFVSSYRDETRAWHAEHLLGTARWCESKGFEPVFIGKTDMNIEPHLVPKTSLPQKLDFGIDLRNKTTIQELASVMGGAKAVCGLDSGPIHLAGTTSVPIVCGYTSVLPEFRIPIRRDGQTVVVMPNIPCIGCESKWESHFWNFENCYLKHIDCCKAMTSDKFIACLEQILRVS
jgi:ADP-heptose:LPS heptosyltransferase